MRDIQLWRKITLYAIETRNLTKVYPGSTTPAISEITLLCPKSTIFSILGENGAGKTTTVKILCTVLSPTSGEAFVLGFNTKEPEEIRKVIGYLPQKSHVSIFFDWTVWSNLKFFSAMNGVTGNAFEAKAAELLKEYSLWEKRDELFRNLSGGMQQKAALIRSIIHEPDVLFLDEPTSGLDVQAKLQTLSMIEQLKKEGRTILLTTHDMDVAERLSDTVAIIRSGRILLQTSVKSLKERYRGKYSLEVFCENSTKEEVISLLKGDADLVHKNPLRFLVSNTDVADVVKKKFPLLDFSLQPVSLEDIYLRVYNEVEA